MSNTSKDDPALRRAERLFSVAPKPLQRCEVVHEDRGQTCVQEADGRWMAYTSRITIEVHVDMAHAEYSGAVAHYRAVALAAALAELGCSPLLDRLLPGDRAKP